jgi:L-alanine-DL-glutamate epimerase-like enolase superfamily enzyme
MGRLASEFDTKIIADESGHWPQGVMLALKAGVRFFNVKPTRQGGIHEGLKSIHAIELFGGACSVGGVMESLLGLTAFSHLGSTVREGSFICMEGGDQLSRFAEGHTPVKLGGIKLDLKEGVIELPKGPGLGVELKEEVMSKFE